MWPQYCSILIKVHLIVFISIVNCLFGKLDSYVLAIGLARFDMAHPCIVVIPSILPWTCDVPLPPRAVCAYICTEVDIWHHILRNNLLCPCTSIQSVRSSLIWRTHSRHYARNCGITFLQGTSQSGLTFVKFRDASLQEISWFQEILHRRLCTIV